MISRILLLALLWVAVIASALAVVYTKYQNRSLFHHSQQLSQEINQLEIEWRQLLLEQSTWGRPQRIEHLARTRLNMHFPRHDEIIFIQR